MALEVSITRRLNDYQKGSFLNFLSPFHPSRTTGLKAKKSLRLPALLMIGFGVLTLGYLSFSFVFGKPQNDSQEKEEVKEVLGVTEEKETTSTFGGLLVSSSNASSAPNVPPQPAPEIFQADLGSFGKILKSEENSSQKNEVLTEFTITIPVLGIKDARVLTNIDGTNESAYQKALEQGIAHFAGSALPGEQGSVFLFGHSMLPILAHGTYLSIFTNLPKLKKGDVIFVEYGNEELRYLVEQTAVVNPKDVFVLRQPQNEELLTLMTCIPPGFGSDRFVAIAKRN